jgi:hypothetical protein
MMQSGQYKSYSGNTNRDRHQKYNHPRGAPDADLIFGSTNYQTNKYLYFFLNFSYLWKLYLSF